MSDVTHFSFHGPEHVSFLPTVLRVIHNRRAKLLDLSLSLLQGQVNATFVVDGSDQDLVDEMAAHARAFKLSLHHHVVSPKANPVTDQFILSCVGQKQISSAFLVDVCDLLRLYDLKIMAVEDLSQNNFKSLDLKLTSPKKIDAFKVKTELMNLSNVHQVDMALLRDDEWRNRRRLIVFDMDSTLIKQEVIDELAFEKGIRQEVRVITDRAMNGELNFDEALRERVALLKGLNRNVMEGIFRRLELSPGAGKLLETVHALGYKTAIVSGGFKYFAEKLGKKLGVHYVYANDLEWDGDVLTGKTLGPVVNAERKAQILEELAALEGLTLDQVVAVGDGANDLPMLAKAGLGIAFHAKEKVRREARYQMSHGPMTTILYFLGIKGHHQP